MSTKAFILGLLIILVLLITTYIGASVYIASVLTIPNKSPVVFDKLKIGDRVADVVFRSKDDAALAGWYFRGTNDKVIMFVHGAGNQNRANEVYGTPDIAKYFLDQGYTILLFDLRGTGESEKTRISFGQYEANDVAGAYNYLIKQEFEPASIGIISDSLGAISTIMAADDVVGAGGVVLDSPATAMKEIVSNIMADEKNVPHFLHPGSFLAAKLFYNIDVDRVRPIDQIGKMTSTPLLFLHGEKDTLIPPVNSEVLLSKVSNGQRIIFPGTKHVETFKDHPKLYLDSVSKFFEDNLK